MNTVKINKMLDSYYKGFDKNWIDEEYKWVEVENFQKNYNDDCDPEKFLDMIKNAIDGSSNLVASKHYYAFDDFVGLAELYPEEVQNGLKLLFDENESITERIKLYCDKIDYLKQQAGQENTAYSKDRRFISTLLFFRYPWKYTIYKYTEDRDFSQEYELGIQVTKGSEYYLDTVKSITELIAAYVADNRPDIVIKYKEKLKNPKYYQDNNYKLLAQNIIWYATTCDYGTIEPGETISVDFAHGKVKESIYAPTLNHNGSPTDYIKKAKESAKVGKSGESFVIEFENNRLKDVGLDKKASWESQNKGDGLGYDVLSYNDDGSKRYIEVKTTNGSANTMFFITATELAACKKYGDNYYLYRVYVEHGERKIEWYRGKEVEALCNCPYQYAVIPKMD